MANRSGIKRIVVGVHGSAQSIAALKWVVRIAKTMDSQITAVYAINMPIYLAPEFGVPFQFDEEWRDGMRTEFESKWCKPLTTSGLRYRTVIEDGRPASVIAALAERECRPRRRGPARERRRRGTIAGKCEPRARPQLEAARAADFARQA
jgi:nucleotide-binding universal stress UspA family protein